jgi:hypothetical protein
MIQMVLLHPSQAPFRQQMPFGVTSKPSMTSGIPGPSTPAIPDIGEAGTDGVEAAFQISRRRARLARQVGEHTIKLFGPVRMVAIDQRRRASREIDRGSTLDSRR